MSTPHTLGEWLAWIEGRHPATTIELGLDRVRAVAGLMAPGPPARHVAVVAGTNGKGSTVAFIEAMARAAGLRVGAYTSPHLLAYNERVRVDGRDAADEGLAAAFAVVEDARARAEQAAGAPVRLTYFEYGTLAALHVFRHADLDLAVLEVGLGGRLDAVNVVQPDVAVITTVDLDHQEWLGSDREAIGREKAGIARAGVPLVLGEDDPPASVLRRAYALGAPAIRAGSDYLFAVTAAGRWQWREPGFELDLPLPSMRAPAQLRNAATAIAALRALDVDIPTPAWARGVVDACAPGRLQHVAYRGVDVLVDVGHNPQAARALADWLRATPIEGRTHALYAALDDKDVSGVVAALSADVDHWHLAGLLEAGPRGRDVATLAERLRGTAAGAAFRHADVDAGLAALLPQADAGDRVLVFGSFHTAGAALQWLRRQG